ncbi:DUF2927 domain-containing protein [Rhodovulum adriaticum]|uniref:DUF2927 family protein n=1 Tax=Rhodovulum adriaticum TaxID=35804 RepID=A0A4R2NV33_RHOAD|nr:DUF2927 domain-containing protein [Rhodovulum adriaticum]MBK1635972.1 ATP-dependent transcriptional regulator [Rhodovulum adriaticum]TCP25431.1 DUF2927 family protein [Rhodovulum adriaticum]
MLRAAVLSVAFLSACTAPVAEMPARLPPNPASLPPMKSFPATQVSAPHRPNREIAQDFLDLAFRMESGRSLPVLTRFETPVTVRVLGDAPPSLGGDLAALLARLRREAGIDIRRVATNQPAHVTIEVMPRAQLQRLVPEAACFVAPRVTSWDEYRRARRSDLVDWTTLTRRERAAIFVPGDVSPQELRDCLHEELAQALGPLNDLYRLPDSVFNDDNFHTVLTGFDMLILRAYYAPELANGMTRTEVARRLPALLARLNPRGERNANRPPATLTDRDWIEAIETALGPRTSASARHAAADRAVALARARGWTDARLAFSLFAQGRLTLANNGEEALRAFLEAGQIYAARPETQVQKAHVGMHLAAFALSSGQANTALDFINGNLGAAVESQNAALLSSMLMIKAEALEMLGRASEARAVRQDALGWARYGFGSERDVRARLAEIAALSPAAPPG